YKSASI
ncbi:Translocation and assembly module TamA precursor, partial [Haemophilus influenzae]